MRRRRISRVRGWVVLVVFASVAVGLAFHTGTGTLSAIGIGSVAAVCPVGALEALLGSHVFMVHPLVLLAIVVVATLVFGKVFCSWMCPISYIRSFFHARSHASTRVHDGSVRPADTARPVETARPAETSAQPHGDPVRPAKGDTPGCPLAAVGGKRDGLRFDSRHVVLIGALISAMVFGFPVFCAICPVGLTFATFISIWHLVQYNEATWGLVVFPGLIALEVIVFGHWCHVLCPISALLSLISAGNRTLRPRVDASRCLRSEGVDCRVCVDRCPEQVDPHSPSIPDCSKCGLCADSCPREAITFPFIYPKAPKGGTPSLTTMGTPSSAMTSAPSPDDDGGRKAPFGGM